MFLHKLRHFRRMCVIRGSQTLLLSQLHNKSSKREHLQTSQNNPPEKLSLVEQIEQPINATINGVHYHVVRNVQASATRQKHFRGINTIEQNRPMKCGLFSEIEQNKKININKFYILNWTRQQGIFFLFAKLTSYNVHGGCALWPKDNWETTSQSKAR
jgi:hypothetical protein